jgi:hypothetical protein
MACPNRSRAAGYRKQNKDDYGYYRVNSPNIKLDDIFPSDALYPVKELQDACMSKMDRVSGIVNLQQQSAECTTLENLVNEKPHKTIDYFATKEMITKEDIKRLVKNK